MSDWGRGWRNDVEVEPTIWSAWDRVNGFEGCEDQQTWIMLAEACGSRTHHSDREGPNRRLWRPWRSPDPFRLQRYFSL